ncbi:MAG: hypothetical protein II282_01430, partial [Alistipes sp.]|nr:hypothetical protein [Alistipes sp.]
VAPRLEQQFPQQRCISHAGDRALAFVHTIGLLGIFAKGTLHGNGIFNDHFVHPFSGQFNSSKVESRQLNRKEVFRPLFLFWQYFISTLT